MRYLTTIGLEVHVQLKTQSKMFCACPTGHGAPPNTLVCPVCLGYPGAMPVMNEEAVHLTVVSGLMIGSHISEFSKFDRKSYFYPDMPKNYQISQFDKPLCEGGSVTITLDGQDKVIGVTRIHLEEDVGKSTHYAKSSGVDFNRAGHPLMEIVSDPDMESPEEAYAYLQALREILLYAGVSDCNLEEGNMRCDVNVSVRPENQTELGTKAELKNLNTQKGVLNSLYYEVSRQTALLERGERVVQETRRWDPDKGITTSMRVKEDAHDYRYFPEPDLLPVVLPREQVEAWRAALPERPRARRTRFVSEYGLPEYDAGVLIASREIADFFETAAGLAGNAKGVSNWIMTEVMRVLGDDACTLSALKLTPESLAELVKLVDSKTINMPGAKAVFEVLVDRGGDPRAIVEEKGLAQVSDTGSIEAFVDQAMQENPQSVEDYRNGKKAAAQFLVGQVMRLSRGKANPQMVGQMIADKLGVE
ncbi:MAG: Asp-tRNA(Asn)/Glu-tRNA(Gln) amidotransferase subunit GatB [Verrucomicrobia bacterium]|jgi:aspartyl-tRNA(Asn)/glutamyl-tRNA(Gln) amidotransferase subunit B|nr:Asp-tRNA(Asn)/Glu-tRNA(Gln) amidotransferase subunit GatB [Verrucomicrobiota bacterium]